MKEQIRELADRLWRVHPSDIDAMGLKTRTDFYEHELKKFAEVIVRECVSTIQAEKDTGLYSAEQMAGLTVAKAVLKDHFGVGE